MPTSPAPRSSCPTWCTTLLPTVQTQRESSTVSVCSSHSIFPDSTYRVYSPVGIAKICEGNLKKTIKCGGRKNPPSSQELQALSVSLCNCFICLVSNIMVQLHPSTGGAVYQASSIHSTRGHQEAPKNTH